jgi:hypothetical protein
MCVLPIFYFCAQDKFHTKVEMVVTRFDNNGIEFVRKEHNPLFGGDGR